MEEKRNRDPLTVFFVVRLFQRPELLSAFVGFVAHKLGPILPEYTFRRKNATYAALYELTLTELSRFNEALLGCIMQVNKSTLAEATVAGYFRNFQEVTAKMQKKIAEQKKEMNIVDRAVNEYRDVVRQEVKHATRI